MSHNFFNFMIHFFMVVGSALLSLGAINLGVSLVHTGYMWGHILNFAGSTFVAYTFYRAYL